jgi:mannose-6-phosphate isomerase-like protein (cupin superfamily)
MNPITPYKEERPWGEFVKFLENSPCTVKLIKVKAGEAFSLQKHSSRSEFWHIISGTGNIWIGDKKIQISKGADYFVPVNTNHRMEAQGEDITFLEIGIGQFDEKDIIRLEDKYNRVKS